MAVDFGVSNAKVRVFFNFGAATKLARFLRFPCATARVRKSYIHRDAGRRRSVMVDDMRWW